MARMNWKDINWQRCRTPLLHAHTHGQGWAEVMLYTPHVIRVDDVWRMWYLGSAGHSRSSEFHLGYATSSDGLHWRPHSGNPVAVPSDNPWGGSWQTPCVLFDEQKGVYKMWFTSRTHIEHDASGNCIALETALGYAESNDGLSWSVHPEPVYNSARRPWVTKLPDGTYRMWMGSRPSPESKWDDLYKNIYEFRSADGIEWKRNEAPLVSADEKVMSCVYPCVYQEAQSFLMLYGCHVDGGRFEIFHATSDDGTKWITHHDEPFFAASGDVKRFDGRYTSTPCIVKDGEKYLLYYSGRPLQNEYRLPDGSLATDGCGVYCGIGVAVGAPRTETTSREGGEL